MAREYLPNILKMLLAGGLSIAAAVAKAEPFPAELVGKSITVKRTTAVNVRWNSAASGTHEGAGSMDVSLDININAGGQADARHSLTGRLPGDLKVDMNAVQGPDGSVRFEGGRLLTDSVDWAGTWQVSITFDAGYGTCHAAVISRHEEVALPTLRTHMRASIPDFKVLSAESSVPVCSVASR
jgi:hypothetical protein